MSYVIVYHGLISLEGVRNAEKMLSISREDGAEKIIFCLSSVGGSVAAGIGLYNFLSMFDLPVDTYNFGQCSSIAATIFIAGSQRYAPSTSRFSFHAATYSDGPLKGQRSPDTDLISKPFIEKLVWGEGEISQHFSSQNEVFVDPHQALKYKILTEVKILKFRPRDQIRHVSVPD